MKRFTLMAIVALLACTGIEAGAQIQVKMSNSLMPESSSSDVFAPIGKYIQAGDCEKLSAWFADNLELDILGATNSCTRNQAKRIMKNFFNNYTPKQFTIIHKSGKAPIKYAVGTLDAGGEKFRLILYVKMDDSRGSIQQLRIERQ